MGHNGWALFQIDAAMSCNRLLFWLKKIPLIKKLFSDQLYGAGETKSVLTAVAQILGLLWVFFKKFLYLFIVIGLPLILKDEGAAAGWPLAVQIFFFLSFFFKCFSSSDMLTATLLRYTCVRQMGMQAKACLMWTTGKTHGLAFITFIPPLMVLSALCGQGPWVGLLLSVELVCARVMGEWLHVVIYTRTGRNLSDNFWCTAVLGIPALVGAYIPLFVEVALLPLHQWLMAPVVVVLFLAAAGACLAWLLRYSEYPELVREICKAEKVSAEVNRQKAAKAGFRDVQLRDSDLSPQADDQKLAGLRGYAYLNGLFFKRHRRLLVRPVKFQLIGVAGVLALGLVACVFARPAMAEIMNLFGQFLPAMVFLMYMLCNGLGERMCRAMFYNCDISLLRYPWYREKSVILRNFSIRLGQIVRLNLLVAGAICVGVLILMVASGARPEMMELVAFLLSVLSLAIFFSVHPLFLYYIFQPYTMDLGVQNPFFKAFNMVVYLLCYLCLQIRQPPSGFAVVVLLATLLYSVVALLVVWRRAPQAFRVK